MIDAQPRRRISPFDVILGVMTAMLLIVLAMTVMGRTAPVAPATLPAPIATARPSLAVGSRVLVQSISMFWVDQTGLAAYNRANANHDERGMLSVMGSYETIWIDPPTQAHITARSGESTQLEFLEGPSAGRRGWTNAFRARDPS